MDTHDRDGKVRLSSVVAADGERRSGRLRSLNESEYPPSHLSRSVTRTFPPAKVRIRVALQTGWTKIRDHY